MSKTSYEMRKYKKSGEVFVCHLESRTMSDMLHHSEQESDLDDYALDNDLCQTDLDDSTVIRSYYSPEVPEVPSV
jgi:hypothetical protein